MKLYAGVDEAAQDDWSLRRFRRHVEATLCGRPSVRRRCMGRAETPAPTCLSNLVTGDTAAYAGSSDTLTISLPVFEPSNNLLSAAGVCSSPSTTSTRYLSLPSIHHLPNSIMASMARGM